MNKIILINPKNGCCYWNVKGGNIHWDKKYNWFWDMLETIDSGGFNEFWMELALSNPKYIKIKNQHNKKD